MLILRSVILSSAFCTSIYSLQLSFEEYKCKKKVGKLKTQSELGVLPTTDLPLMQTQPIHGQHSSSRRDPTVRRA